MTEPFCFNPHSYLYDEWGTYDLLSYSDVSANLSNDLRRYRNFIFNDGLSSYRQSSNILFDRFVPFAAPFAEELPQKIYGWLKQYTGTIVCDYQFINMKNKLLFANTVSSDSSSLYDPSLTTESFGSEYLNETQVRAYDLSKTYYLTIPPTNQIGDLTITYYSPNPLQDVADSVYDLVLITIPMSSESQSIAINLKTPLLGSLVIGCNDPTIVGSINNQLPNHLLYININIIINNINNNINNNYKRIKKVISKINYTSNTKTGKTKATSFEYIDRPQSWEQIALYTAKNNYWGHQQIYPDLSIDRYKYKKIGINGVERNQRLNRNPQSPPLKDGNYIEFDSFTSAYGQGNFESKILRRLDNRYEQTTPLTIGAYTDSKFGSEVELSNGDFVNLHDILQIPGYLLGICGKPLLSYLWHRYIVGPNNAGHQYQGLVLHCARTTKYVFTEDTAKSYEYFYSNFQEDWIEAPATFNSVFMGAGKPARETNITFPDVNLSGVLEYVYDINPVEPKGIAPIEATQAEVVNWINRTFWEKKDANGDFIYPVNTYRITEILNGKQVYKRYANDTPMEINQVPDSIRLKEIHAALAAQKFATDDTGNERIANLGYYVERIARVLGVSVNDDGSVRSIRQRAKLEDGSTIPAGWNFGQFGLNSGNNLEGQQGGKSDERRDGIAYQQISNQLKPDTFDPEKSEISGGDVILCENWPQLIQTILEDLDLALNLQESAAGAIPAGDGSGRVMLYQGLGELVAELAYGQSRISGHTSRTLISSQSTQAVAIEILQGLGLPLTTKVFSRRIGEGEDDQAKIPYPGLDAGSPTITSQMGWLLQNVGVLLANSVYYSEQDET